MNKSLHNPSHFPARKTAMNKSISSRNRLGLRLNQSLINRVVAPSKERLLQPCKVPQGSTVLNTELPSLKLVAECTGTKEMLPPTEDEITAVEYKVDMASPAAVDMTALGREARETIDSLLPRTGAMLLRRLPISDPAACSAFVKGMGFKHMSYQPFGGPRKKVGDLDAATNLPGTFMLDPHNEMCYNPQPNLKIFLMCLCPADEGGDSIMQSGAAIMKVMPQQILDLFESKGGLRYVRLYPSDQPVQTSTPPTCSFTPNLPGPFQLSWQERTGCLTKAEAEAFWKALGCDTEWMADESLVVTNVQPALAQHPVSGEPLWFNLAHGGAWSAGIQFGDGTLISKEVIDTVKRALATAPIRALKLEAGDMLALDNYAWLHGRTTYSGVTERVLVTVLTEN